MRECIGSRTGIQVKISQIVKCVKKSTHRVCLRTGLAGDTICPTKGSGRSIQIVLTVGKKVHPFIIGVIHVVLRI